MNTLFLFASNPLLVAVLLQVTVATVLASVLGPLLFRRRPDVRHALALAAIVWTLLAPVLVPLAPRSGISLVNRRHVTDPLTTAVVAIPESPPPAAQGLSAVPPLNLNSAPVVAQPLAEPLRRNLPRRSTSEPPMIPASSYAEGLRGTLVLAWCAGLLFNVARLLQGFLRLSQLLRSTLPFDPAPHESALTQARDAFGLTTLPPIVTSSMISSPLVAGLLNPRIILPAHLPCRLDDSTLRDLLIHEIAHILRHDLKIGLLERLAATLFWPHPFVHLLNAQLDRAREELCDNHALLASAPTTYARTLLNLTELCNPRPHPDPGLPLLTRRWNLVDRVADILHPQRTTMTHPPLGTRLVLIASLSLTAFISASLLSPPQTLAAPPPPPSPFNDPDRPLPGLVVDESGRHVPNALVWSTAWSNDKGNTSQPVRTAEDGTFAVVLHQPYYRGENFTASAEEGALFGSVHVEQPEHSRPVPLVRIVVHPTYTLNVRVVDASDAPVPDADVAADVDHAASRARTNADGLATLRLPVGGAVTSVVARKSGVGLDYEVFRGRRGLPDIPVPKELKLTLDGARTVRVKAVDSSNHPVPGLEIRPFYLRKPGKRDSMTITRFLSANGLTDASGVATFDWFPSRFEDSIPFLIHDENFSFPKRPEARAYSDADLTVFVSRNTRLSGAVRFPDGRPAPGVLINANGRGPNSDEYGSHFARTRSDGTYSLTVESNQSYMLTVRDEDWTARSITHVITREHLPQSGLDFTLDKGTILRARITQKPHDQPIVSARVMMVQNGPLLPKVLMEQNLLDYRPSVVWHARTDADGRFSFRVGPGEYQYEVDDRAIVGKFSIDAPRGPDLVKDISLSAPLKSRSVLGLVLEATPSGNRPVPHAVVEAVLDSRMHYSQIHVVADENGRFAIEHPSRRTDPNSADAPVLLYTRSPDGGLAAFTIVPRGVEDVSVTVDKATRLTGRVVDATGRPLPDWPLSISLDQRTENDNHLSFFLKFQADARGQFSIPGIYLGATGVVGIEQAGDRVALARIVQHFSVTEIKPTLLLPDLVFNREVSQ